MSDIFTSIYLSNVFTPSFSVCGIPNILKIDSVLKSGGWTGQVLVFYKNVYNPCSAMRVSFKDTDYPKTEEWTFEFLGSAVDKVHVYGDIMEYPIGIIREIASRVLKVVACDSAPDFDQCTVALRSVYNETMVEETVVSCTKENIDWMFEYDTNPRIALACKYGKILSHIIRKKTEKFSPVKIEVLGIGRKGTSFISGKTSGFGDWRGSAFVSLKDTTYPVKVEFSWEFEDSGLWIFFLTGGGEVSFRDGNEEIPEEYRKVMDKIVKVLSSTNYGLVNKEMLDI